MKYKDIIVNITTLLVTTSLWMQYSLAMNNSTVRSSNLCQELQNSALRQVNNTSSSLILSRQLLDQHNGSFSAAVITAIKWYATAQKIVQNLQNLNVITNFISSTNSKKNLSQQIQVHKLLEAIKILLPCTDTASISLNIALLTEAYRTNSDPLVKIIIDRLKSYEIDNHEVLKIIAAQTMYHFLLDLLHDKHLFKNVAQLSKQQKNKINNILELMLTLPIKDLVTDMNQTDGQARAISLSNLMQQILLELDISLFDEKLIPQEVLNFKIELSEKIKNKLDKNPRL